MACRFTVIGALLTVSFVLSSPIDSIKAHVSGDIICSKPSFQYKMVVLGRYSSHDPRFPDHIQEFGYSSSPQYSLDFAVSGSDGDDGPNYEIYLAFTHNCSDSGDWLKYENKVGVMNKGHSTVRNHTINLTNASGELTNAGW
ncbi:hypothetical protein CAEBREN_04392 [Caenorhabditis brenneri]|uniref:Uncharacterized protein n=1 Tax=Caenorhabditis brenneri TaxID=135651 RepID=G0MPM5_CAEBE|nr:hypothetical protein CAEBREN_04392 [Caenorhabditis brenneri]